MKSLEKPKDAKSQARANKMKEEAQRAIFSMLDRDKDGELSILDINWLKENFPAEET